MALIDHIDAVAKRKMKTPGWEPYAWEAIGPDGTMVTGGIPRRLKSGPRKGEKTWEGKGDQVVVVQAEIVAEMASYEQETGKCCQCMGQGQVAAGWSAISGARFRSCSICEGTGLKGEE